MLQKYILCRRKVQVNQILSGGFNTTHSPSTQLNDLNKKYDIKRHYYSFVFVGIVSTKPEESTHKPGISAKDLSALRLVMKVNINPLDRDFGAIIWEDLQVNARKRVVYFVSYVLKIEGLLGIQLMDDKLICMSSDHSIFNGDS